MQRMSTRNIGVSFPLNFCFLELLMNNYERQSWDKYLKGLGKKLSSHFPYLCLELITCIAEDTLKTGLLARCTLWNAMD